MASKKEKKSYKWVIMIYACANDRNSENGMTNFFKELNEIGKYIDARGNKAELKILLHAYRDWGTKQRHAYYAKRFEIKNHFLKKGKASKDVVYTRLYTNMGDPNALSDFIFWCKTKYDAEHYLLLLWGHGAQYGMFTGTLTKAFGAGKKPQKFSMTVNGKEIQTINQLKPVKQTIEQQYRVCQQVDIKFHKKNNTGLFDTDTIERKIINTGTTFIGSNKIIIPPSVIYYFNVDENNRLETLTELIPRRTIDDSLTVEEICKSLWDTGHYIKSQGNIEIIMIFGCAMQTFELAYELSKCGSLGCNYLIASEELIYWEGYDYKKSFLRLLENPNIPTEEFCKHIIDDTKSKRPRRKNPGDGHKDKPAWAVSCINVKKVSYATKLIDDISKKLLELSKYELFATTQLKKNIKADLLWEYWKALLDARAQCHHFGEAAFYDSYIDITWFFKSLKRRLKKSKGDFKKQEVPSLLKMYNKIISDLGKAIQYLEKKIIVAKFIGNKRNEEAIWVKIILNKNVKGKKVYSSTGAHGINIFFPISNYITRKYLDEKFFFISESDYNLEFQLNLKKTKNWHLMINEYGVRNRYTRAQLFKNGKFFSISKDAEPDLIGRAFKDYA